MGNAAAGGAVSCPSSENWRIPMSWEGDEEWYRREEFEQQLINDELQRISEEPVINYLASNGDAIEARVLRCLAPSAPQ